ncbi:MAG: fumarylacetoacetate hydrolase family protein [Firmicutes bacterium]|nr:fumarylacetoacetate hydrolase family protein [Bacillota bacterium]
MKLISFTKNGKTRAGVIKGKEGIVDLGDHFSSLLAIIEGGGRALARVRKISQEERPSLQLAEAELLAPIPVPRRNVFCVGWNYHKHFEEGVGKRGAYERTLPKHPTFFTKPTTAVNAPYGVIPIDPAFSTRFDYEVELAVVIKKEGRSIPLEEASDYIFGYLVANDISARDIQQRHGGQWLKGKAMDGSCPMGPWITTADEIPDPQDLTLQCFVNGEKRQDGSSKEMIFSVNRIISELSFGMTLLPGDLILTGTPDGVGAGRDPEVFLKEGDRLITSISGLGELRHTLGLQPLASPGKKLPLA